MTPDELKDRTKAFAVRIVTLTEALPRSKAAQHIGGQLLHSGTAVGSNYRAACRARSHAEFLSKLAIVVEESDESVYWLDVLAESRLVKPGRLGGLQKEANELLAIFSAARKTARAPEKG